MVAVRGGRPHWAIGVSWALSAASGGLRQPAQVLTQQDDDVLGGRERVGGDAAVGQRQGGDGLVVDERQQRRAAQRGRGVQLGEVAQERVLGGLDGPDGDAALGGHGQHGRRKAGGLTSGGWSGL